MKSVAATSVVLIVIVMLPATALHGQWKVTDSNQQHIENTNPGSVGVGTSFPNSKLHVAGTITVGPIDGDAYRIVGATNGNLRWALTSSAAGVFGILPRGDDWVSQGTALLIDRAGNVGIGQMPGGKLANTSVSNDDGATGNNSNTFNWASAAAGYSATIVNHAVIGHSNALLVKTADTQRPTLVLAAMSGANLPRLVVTGDGNVGVGTKYPSSRLQVEGNVAFAENHSALGAGATRFIGIPGVTAGSFAGAGAFIAFTQGGTNGVSNDLRFFTHESGVTAGERMRIDEAGRVGIGMVPRAAYRLDVDGNANFEGTVTGTEIRATYQDVAEWVPATTDLAAGTVVVLNTARNNEVKASASAYDTTVAGVVSAQPGLSLGIEGAGKEQIATTGRVKVRVDARRSPIRVGDLLVTSDVPGTAMRSEPLDLGGHKLHRPGTIIGKALEPLESGIGEILVLLSMQ